MQNNASKKDSSRDHLNEVRRLMAPHDEHPAVS